jgi:hypothetical protein
MTTAREQNHSTEQFVGWETYLKNHHSLGGEVFKSRDSLEWFCRRHTNALIASGQLVPRKGPAGTLYGPLFTKVALEILRELQLAAMHYMTVKGSQNSPHEGVGCGSDPSWVSGQPSPEKPSRAGSTFR